MGDAGSGVHQRRARHQRAQHRLAALASLALARAPLPRAGERLLRVRGHQAAQDADVVRAGRGPAAVAFAAPFAVARLGVLELRLPVATEAFAREALPVCSGGHRAVRKLTCIVDGDTGWEAGEKWRLEGIDAPELSKPECGAEKAKATASRDRLRALMGGGYEMSRGEPDRYGRTLVTVTLADGRDVGDVLMTEGLAQPWPNHGNVWCGRR